VPLSPSYIHIRARVCVILCWPAHFGNLVMRAEKVKIQTLIFRQGNSWKAACCCVRSKPIARRSQTSVVAGERSYRCETNLCYGTESRRNENRCSTGAPLLGYKVKGIFLVTLNRP